MILIECLRSWVVKWRWIAFFKKTSSFIWIELKETANFLSVIFRLTGSFSGFKSYPFY